MLSGRSFVAWVVLSAAALGGCAGAPRGIIGELPTESIIITRRRPVRPPRRVVKPPAAFPADWLKTATQRPWRWIVVHHSASESGSAATFDKWHRARGWDELGYHFVIDNGRGGPDGLVEVGARWRKQKWGAHCKTPDNRYNDFGIGICLVGDFTKAPPTPAQLASLRTLVAVLSDRFSIPSARVIGHGQAPGVNTACPGTFLSRHLHGTLCPYLTRRAQLARR